MVKRRQSGGLRAGPVDETMPTLFRFLFVIGLLGGLGYGVLYALANYTDPKPRQITVTIPQNQLTKHR